MPNPTHASMFAQKEQEYSFGISPESAAEALRVLANKIDKGLVLIDKVVVQSTAEKAEYTESLLWIKYAEKVNS